MGPSQGYESGVTQEVAEQGCAIFGVPSGLFSPEFDASFVRGGAPEVDGDEAVALGEIDGDGETFRLGRRELRIVPQTTSSGTSGNGCATRHGFRRSSIIAK